MRGFKSKLRPGRRMARAVGASLFAGLTFAIIASGASLPGSNFEIDTDANLRVDGAAPALDWANVAETRKADKPTGATDDSFGNGTKEDDAVPTVVDGSIPPNKSDLRNFGVYLETTPSGARFLNLFWHRVQDPSGTTNMDFEFNQSSQISANGVTPVRTAGDLLIQYDLANGGTNPVLRLSRWIGPAGNPADCQASNTVPCWSQKENLTAAGDATGSINTSAIPAAQADGLGAIDPRTFGEAQLDFDALTGGTNRCRSFGSAYLKSRSSATFTAALKDFIAPANVDLNQCAKVIIRKQTNPEEDPNTTSFGFTKNFNTDPSSANTFSLMDDGVKDYGQTVLPGTGLTVTENQIPNGWDLQNINCDASTGVTPAINGATVTFNIDSSADVLDCTYRNRARGTIEIEKQTTPAGGTGFGFTSDLPAPDDVFSLDDDGVRTAGPLLAGSYQVTEDDPTPGYDLTDITCTDPDNGTSTSLGDRRANIDLDPGETVHCTYTNVKRGRIIVRKITDDGSGAFDFTSTTLTPSSFTLTTTGAGAGGSDSRAFPNLIPGTYDVDETVPAGWNLVGTPTCSDGSSVGSINLSAGETVTCTFHDTRETGAIRVIKLRKHAADGPGDHPHANVDFVITGGELPAGGTTITTDPQGRACLDGLVLSSHAGVGNYRVHEVTPPGYNGEADKFVAVDNEATCGDDPYGGESRTFHNTPLTDITLSVDSQVDGGTASQVDCGGGATGSTGANGDGSVSRNNLEPGTYTCTVVVDP